MAFNIMKGDYTPTISDQVNFTYSTGTFHYVKFGNIVVITGIFQGDVTVADTLTEFRATLPFARVSTFGYDIIGAGISGNNQEQVSVTGGTDNLARFRLRSASTAARLYTFEFGYLIK